MEPALEKGWELIRLPHKNQNRNMKVPRGSP
jgi:hypothetical protein